MAGQVNRAYDDDSLTSSFNSWTKKYPLDAKTEKNHRDFPREGTNNSTNVKNTRGRDVPNNRGTPSKLEGNLKHKNKKNEDHAAEDPNASDGETSTAPLLSGPGEEPEMWNAFRETLDEPSNDFCDRLFVKASKCCKVFTIIICCLLLLACTVVSQGTILFMAANVKPSSNLLCQAFLDTANGGQEISCLRMNNSNQQNILENSQTYDLNYKILNDLNGTIDNCGSQIPSCIVLQNENKTMVPVGCLFESETCICIHIRWLWCICLALVTPNFFVFVRCVWICLLKKTKKPSLPLLILSLATATVHQSGLSILAYGILPHLPDSLHGLTIFSTLLIIPSLLQIFNKKTPERCKGLKILLDIIGFLSQVFVMVYIILKFPDPDNYLIWAVPLGLVLTSIGWWENFVDHFPFRTLMDIKESLYETKSWTNLLCSIWKICISILLILPFSETGNVSDIFNFSSNDERCQNSMGTHQLTSMELDWVFVWLIHTSAGLVGYFVARFAAKANVQRLSYALPITLSTPVAFSILVAFCEIFESNNCSFTGIPTHSFFNCYETTWYGDNHWLLLINWFVGLWINRHIWFPPKERLAKSHRIFIAPLYDGIVLEQSLTLNRRAELVNPEHSETVTKVKDRMGGSCSDLGSEEDLSRPLSDDEIPHVFVCATMWHETETEMKQLLTSILRLDKDQCCRKLAIEKFKITDPDYYTFEAHVFFDDVMELDELSGYQPNRFVETFVKTMDIAANLFYEWDDSNALSPPKRIETPYGARLVWQMLGGHTLSVHLKDKSKIRPRKRWSQVMYMYYLLGWKVMQNGFTELGWKRLTTKLDKTFILALDGDVDFQPCALLLLIDRMKKDSNMAAACGRVHPIGSGPMVWYQKFEYAMGHWMQKATEHVLGCVLCTPGCFSLFRGACLIDDNVMRKYATPPTEAQHYVQYDQGEDRWLCTLLLKQGYRVEYSAASDSYTFAPETFDEFYNQRRRWTPSTLANIFDLLSSWRLLVNRNENLSSLYMLYQAVMTFWALLGTGSIFLMIVGAFSLVVVTISVWGSFFINLAPLAIYLAVCLICKAKIQLRLAAVLTAWYAVLQMMVLVSVIVQMAAFGVESSTSVFFFYVMGTFVFAAIIHPREFFDIVHGFVYFLAIPSMFMLLMIFVVANLNNVSWGTREVKHVESAADNVVDNTEFGKGNKGIVSLFARTAMKLKSTFKKETAEEAPLLASENNEDNNTADENDEQDPINMKPQPKWTEDNWVHHPILGEGPFEQLEEKEKKFFERLIEEYLFPLNETRAHKKRIESDLNEMRNSVMIAYVLINAIFVITVFSLQLNADFVSIKWPLGDEQYIEPIGFSFLLFFVVVMLIQTFGMIVHRVGTLQHVIATTKMSGQNLDDIFEVIQDMARPTQEEPGESTPQEGSRRIRDPLTKIRDRRSRRIVGKTLSQAFSARSQALDRGEGVDDVMGKTIRNRPRKRDTIRALYMPNHLLHDLSRIDDESQGTNSSSTTLEMPMKNIQKDISDGNSVGIKIQVGGTDIDDVIYQTYDNNFRRTPLTRRAFSISDSRHETEENKSNHDRNINGQFPGSNYDGEVNPPITASRSWDNIHTRGHPNEVDNYSEDYDAPLTPVEKFSNQFLQVRPPEHAMKRSSSDTYLPKNV